jgi:hypothetical protein
MVFTLQTPTQHHKALSASSSLAPRLIRTTFVIAYYIARHKNTEKPENDVSAVFQREQKTPRFMSLCTTLYLGFKFQCRNKKIYVTFYRLHGLTIGNRTA